MNQVKPWLDTAGKFVVEHIPCPHFNQPVNLAGPRTGVVHTTEGHWDDGLAVFKQHFAPHFLVGAGRIAQLVQVGGIGAALVHHNPDAIVQIEVVGFSKQELWFPDDPTAEALAALMAVCQREYGIPLTHPWADGDYGRYGDNPHRHAGKWGVIAGWYGHGDVPSPDCVVPETPILCADLTWRPAGDLKVGDAIIGFDEHQDIVAGIFDNRRLGVSYVERNFIAPKPCARVVTDVGEVMASVDHPFLTRMEYRRNYASGKGGIRERWGWKSTNDLEKGDEIAFLAEPWKPADDYDAGWLAGFFDGEGCLSLKASKQFAVTAAQVLGPTADKLVSLLDKYGFVHHVAHRTLENRKPSMQVIIQGGRVGAMRFLGEIRPSRLVAKANVIWENALVSRTVRKAKVLDIIDAGERDVASLSTSSRTYVANGFMVHNSHWDPGALQWSKLFALANGMTDILHAPGWTPPAEPARPCAACSGAPAATLPTPPPADGQARRKWIQAFLQAHGSPDIGVDGVLGDESTKAIADFLAKHAA